MRKNKQIFTLEKEEHAMQAVYVGILFSICLKGPKHEIFGSRVFMQSNPVWVGDLGSRTKNLKFDGLGLKITILQVCLASAHKIFKCNNLIALKNFMCWASALKIS
jgi:hypothetical protein